MAPSTLALVLRRDNLTADLSILSLLTPERCKYLSIEARTLLCAGPQPAYTEGEITVGTWLGECCRQVEVEEVSNSRNKIHKTWGPLYTAALYGERKENLIRLHLRFGNGDVRSRPHSFRGFRLHSAWIFVPLPQQFVLDQRGRLRLTIW